MYCIPFYFILQAKESAISSQPDKNCAEKHVLFDQMLYYYCILSSVLFHFTCWRISNLTSLKSIHAQKHMVYSFDQIYAILYLVLFHNQQFIQLKRNSRNKTCNSFDQTHAVLFHFTCPQIHHLTQLHNTDFLCKDTYLKMCFQHFWIHNTFWNLNLIVVNLKAEHKGPYSRKVFS